MLKLKQEKVFDSKDERIIKAFQDMLNLYQDNNLKTCYEEIQKAKFEDHFIGIGGNHIWIVRKDTEERIAIITD